MFSLYVALNVEHTCDGACHWNALQAVVPTHTDAHVVALGTPAWSAMSVVLRYGTHEGLGFRI